MIDYQERFKRRLFFVLSVIFILPLIVVFYIKYNLDVEKQINPALFVKKTAALHLRGTARDIKISKDLHVAYIVGSSRGVYIIDITKPLKPKIISQFKYLKNSYDKARNVELAESKNMLFVRDAQMGVYSIDIENLSEPKFLNIYKINLPIYTFCIAKDTNSIYISDRDGIKKLNIKNSDEMKVVAKYNQKKRYADMIEAGKNIVYALYTYGIDIIDFNFLDNPKLVKSYIAFSDSDKITIYKNRAFLSSRNGVEILDITNKLNPKSIGIFKTSGVIDVVVSKDLRTIYIAHSDGFIEIVDIHKADNAKILQRIYVGSKAKIWKMALSGDEKKLFISNGINGLKVIFLK